MADNVSEPTPNPETSGDDQPRPDDEHRTDTQAANVTALVYDVGPPAPAFQFTHDKEKRLFILAWPDGKVEHFRGNPARQLVVEPDRKTGEIRPVIRNGQPVYMHLCREEREVR